MKYSHATLLCLTLFQFQLKSHAQDDFASGQVKNITGTWLIAANAMLTLDSTNHFKIYCETVVEPDKSDMTAQEGSYRYYFDSAKKLDAILFYDITGSRKNSFLKKDTLIIHFAPTSNYRNSDEAFTAKDFVSNKTYHFYRFENAGDTRTFQDLNKWISGTTWANAEKDERWHFKVDHRATAYEEFLESDTGWWFFTFGQNGSVLKTYLWLVLGRTFGIKKYEVSLSKSGNDLIYWRDVTQKSQEFTPVYLHKNLDVPEDLIGITFFEMVTLRRNGERFKEGLSGGKLLERLIDVVPGNLSHE